MEKRVVITGLGIYSCLGDSLSKVKESLYKGKSGIIFEEERIRQGFQSGLTGYVKEPNLKGSLSRRQRLGLGQPSSYAYVSTRDALNDAKIDQDFLDKNEEQIWRLTNRK